MRRLPPFAELVAFDAVARHLSFTLAAAELCITQSAVSHRIRRLERYYGAPLLRRLNPGLALTDAGAALLPQVQAALDGLEQVARRGERKLRVAAAAALCTWWLAGRLAQFMATRPGVTLELVPIENEHTPLPDVDVRILWVGPDHDATTPTQRALFVEQVFPVCSPRLLRNGRALRDATALDALPLLHKTYRSTGEWSWAVWLDRLGVDAARRRGGELRFADIGLVLSAAVDGAGVALARSLLVHDALRDGRLVVPIAGVAPMPSTKRHVARWPRERADDPDIHAFVDWLADESAAAVAAVERWLLAPAAPASGAAPTRALQGRSRSSPEPTR